MSATFLRRPPRRLWLLLGAALASGPAWAGDKPATPDGAGRLQALFDQFLPSKPGGPALVTVKPDGGNYLVSAELDALNGLLTTVGAPVTYDPATLVYKLFEQNDGKWRVEQDSLPKIVSHVPEGTSSIEIQNFKQSILVDPALAWWVSGSASADKGALTMEAPHAHEKIAFGPVAARYATSVNTDGTVSTSVNEEIQEVVFEFSAGTEGGKASAASGRLDKAAFRVGADGFKTRKAFDLATLLSAHRADLAAHETELKDLLKELVAPGLKFAEGGEASKLMVSTPLGAVALAELKAAVAIADAGPRSSVETRLSAGGLSLPVGLAPPGATDLTPSKIDLTATLTGFDLSAGANEAITRMRLGSEGPTLSDEDAAKVAQAFLGAGPLRLELAPSHVVAPAIDADLSGALAYAGGKPSGQMTIHMRDFDKTMAAIRALGPGVAAKSLPGLAMAKGLAKTEADGSLTWVVEVGQDRSLKVNGIPLGKAP